MAKDPAADLDERQDSRKCAVLANRREIDALVAKHVFDDVLPLKQVKVSPATLQANEIVPSLGITGVPLDAKPARVSLAQRRHRTWWLWK